VRYGGIRDLLALNVLQAFEASLTKGQSYLQAQLKLGLVFFKLREVSYCIRTDLLGLDLLVGTLFKPIDNNGVLYERALELLKPDALLSSAVQDAKRTANGVELSVK
jgi:hypothetical protein